MQILDWSSFIKQGFEKSRESIFHLFTFSQFLIETFKTIFFLDLSEVTITLTKDQSKICLNLPDFTKIYKGF
jgi:hypothetical protein